MRHFSCTYREFEENAWRVKRLAWVGKVDALKKSADQRKERGQKLGDKIPSELDEMKGRVNKKFIESFVAIERQFVSLKDQLKKTSDERTKSQLKARIKATESQIGKLSEQMGEGLKIERGDRKEALKTLLEKTDSLKMAAMKEREAHKFEYLTMFTSPSFTEVVDDLKSLATGFSVAKVMDLFGKYSTKVGTVMSYFHKQAGDYVGSAWKKAKEMVTGGKKKEYENQATPKKKAPKKNKLFRENEEEVAKKREKVESKKLREATDRISKNKKFISFNSKNETLKVGGTDVNLSELVSVDKKNIKGMFVESMDDQTKQEVMAIKEFLDQKWGDYVGYSFEFTSSSDERMKVIQNLTIVSLNLLKTEGAGTNIEEYFKKNYDAMKGLLADDIKPKGKELKSEIRNLMLSVLAAKPEKLSELKAKMPGYENEKKIERNKSLDFSSVSINNDNTFQININNTDFKLNSSGEILDPKGLKETSDVNAISSFLKKNEGEIYQLIRTIFSSKKSSSRMKKNKELSLRGERNLMAVVLLIQKTLNKNGEYIDAMVYSKDYLPKFFKQYYPGETLEEASQRILLKKNEVINTVSENYYDIK
ncbi:MAG: hypothetical protein P1V18_02645 [Candidatus Gracilibacteria bacterium]|nr:hypothetical protein [Candidatus Gracilibacteria bacterium]